MGMSERRIRQIIREELVAAGLKPGPSVIGRIHARRGSFYSPAVVRGLVDSINEFVRNGGTLIRND